MKIKRTLWIIKKHLHSKTNIYYRYIQLVLHFSYVDFSGEHSETYHLQNGPDK